MVVEGFELGLGVSGGVVLGGSDVEDSAVAGLWAGGCWGADVVRNDEGDLGVWVDAARELF